MKHLEKLSEQEKDELIKAPVYVSLLAANADDGQLDENEEEAAVKVANSQTYTADPVLENYYKEVKKTFVQNMRQLNDLLPREKKERELAIKEKLQKLSPILAKLDSDFVLLLKRSFKTFTEHITKGEWSIMASLLYPFYYENAEEKEIKK